MTRLETLIAVLRAQTELLAAQDAYWSRGSGENLTRLRAAKRALSAAKSARAEAMGWAVAR